MTNNMGRVNDLQLEAFEICDALWEESTESIIETASIIEGLKKALNISSGTANDLYEQYCEKFKYNYSEPDTYDVEAFASVGWGTYEDYGRKR